MRFQRTTRTLIAMGLVGATAASWVGCSAKKQTELVPGVSTQVRVPKELKSIRIDAVVSGSNVFCGVYDVINGVARLPRTLALQSTGKGTQVTVYVTGYQQATTDSTATQDQSSCNLTPIPVVKDPKHPEGTSRVLRSAKTNYRSDHVLFLPMPLRFSCFDTNCPVDQNQVCKAGKCVAADVDENTLPDYNDNLIFGNSSTCFSPKFCLADEVLPELIDAKTCTYALWGAKGAPAADPSIPFKTTGQGLNVRAFFDDGSVSEVLDYDKDEGYFVPDQANPQIFQLADGLCHPGKTAAHKVVGLTASGLCASKTVYQPLCDEESPSNPDSDASVAPADPGGASCGATEIHPAPSALVVLMDDTTQMQSFFGTAGAQQVLQLGLQDPVFENTDLVFAFTPGATQCGGTFQPELPATPPTKVTDAQAKIAQLIGSKDPLALSTQPRALSVALPGAYSTLLGMSATTAYNKLGVLVLGDGDFGPDCGSSSSLRDVRIAGGDLPTYTVLFGRQDLQPNPTGLANAQQLGNASTFNADDMTGGSHNNALDALAQVTEDLATCLYTAPVGLKGKGSVAYLNPLPPAQSVRIPFDTTCTRATATTANGWNLETVSGSSETRVRICGNDCSNLRSVLKNTAGIAIKSKQPPPAIPIYVQSCTDQPPTPSVDGGIAPIEAGVIDSGTDSGSDAGIKDAATDGG
jgi:hypothetical protein